MNLAKTYGEFWKNVRRIFKTLPIDKALRGKIDPASHHLSCGDSFLTVSFEN